MSKYHKIRWTEQDTKEITKVVRNFNNKITRISKKNPEISNILPEKISAKQLKELINTRQDLNRELNALRRFSKRGSEEVVIVPDTEYDLKITKWQRTEMNRRIGIINRRRKARLENLQNAEMTSRGENLGYTIGQFGMGKATEVALRPMTAFYRTMGNIDLKKRWQSILIQSQSDYFTKRDYQNRNNYVQSMLDNFHYVDVSDIAEKIMNMDINDFYEVFTSEGSTYEMNYPDADKEEQYANALRKTWNVEGNITSKSIIVENLNK